jgi:hypothetical protein
MLSILDPDRLIAPLTGIQTTASDAPVKEQLVV